MRVKHFISKCIAKSALVSLTLSLFLGSIAPMAANAATITAAKDTMTRLKVGNGGSVANAAGDVRSDHVFTFTLPNAWNSGDVVFLDFTTATNDFIVNATSNWAAADFTIDGLLTTGAAAETETVQLGTFSVDATPAIGDITFPACSPDTTANVVVSGVFTTTTLVDPVFGFKRCATAGAEGGTAITITISAEANTTGQIENPSTSGSQRLSVCIDDTFTTAACTDTAFIAVGIAADDQVTTTATVDPSLTFRVGKKTATFSTNCDASFTDATDGGTVAFGRLSLATIYNSGDAGATGGDTTLPPLCTLVSTNASGGATVTVKGNTAGLVSTSGTPDNIASATAAMSTGTENFGICVVNTGTTSGTALASASPFASTCALASNTNSVGAITTSAQNILTQTTGPSNQSYATISMDINVTALTDAHDDYTLTMTFIATGTF